MSYLPPIFHDLSRLTEALWACAYAVKGTEAAILHVDEVTGQLSVRAHLRGAEAIAEQLARARAAFCEIAEPVFAHGVDGVVPIVWSTLGEVPYLYCLVVFGGSSALGTRWAVAVTVSARNMAHAGRRLKRLRRYVHYLIN